MSGWEPVYSEKEIIVSWQNTAITYKENNNGIG